MWVRDNDRYRWLMPAGLVSSGGSVFEPRRPGDVAPAHKEQRKYTVMVDVIAVSSLKGTDGFLGELNLGGRTANLTVDGTAYHLDVSEAVPVLRPAEAAPSTLH